MLLATKPLFEELYQKLSNNYDQRKTLQVATNLDGLLAVFDNGHRASEIIFIFPPEESDAQSFLDLLTLAGHTIENDPDEITCVDTDMTSYNIHATLDLHHEDYQESLPEEIRHWVNNRTQDTYLACIHIQPQDYYS